MRKAKIVMNNNLAGYLTENEDGYLFIYDKDYLKGAAVKPISLTLPLQEKPHISRTMFPFFDGLIPEGWLLEIAEKNWKLNARDRMGLLLVCCRDCIGAVSVEEDNT
jgi:serine/threonine-protein kinase HipA